MTTDETTEVRETEQDTDKGAGHRFRIDEKVFGNKDKPKFVRTRKGVRKVEGKFLFHTAKIAHKYADWADIRCEETKIRIAELEQIQAERDLQEKKERVTKLKEDREKSGTTGTVPPASGGGLGVAEGDHLRLAS